MTGARGRAACRTLIASEDGGGGASGRARMDGAGESGVTSDRTALGAARTSPSVPEAPSGCVAAQPVSRTPARSPADQAAEDLTVG